jgi:hypothetical protein
MSIFQMDSKLKCGVFAGNMLSRWKDFPASASSGGKWYILVAKGE